MNKLIEKGTFPDVLYFGDGFLTAQMAGKIVLYRWTPGKLSSTLKLWWSKKLDADSQAFPKLGALNGELLLAYRTGPLAGRLRNVTRETEVQLGRCGGNHPFGFGPIDSGIFGYRRSVYDTRIRDLRTGKETKLTHLSAMGLSHFDKNKVPYYMDDLFAAVPWGTRPCAAGKLIAAEGPNDNGVLARFFTVPDKQAKLWRGEKAFVPRCAMQGEQYAVTVGQPVRLAELTVADATSAVPA